MPNIPIHTNKHKQKNCVAYVYYRPPAKSLMMKSSNEHSLPLKINIAKIGQVLPPVSKQFKEQPRFMNMEDFYFSNRE